MLKSNGLSSVILLEIVSIRVASIIEFHQVVLTNPCEVSLADINGGEVTWVGTDVGSIAYCCVSCCVIICILRATLSESLVICETCSSEV
jgi:hypothetical protein